MSGQPPRDAGLPPGYDAEDPYAGVDIEELPDWWRRNIEEFEAFDMRPYRPPRLADDTIVPPYVSTLEDEHGVEIRFRCTQPTSGQWELVVDDCPVATVEHERDGGGFSRFHIEPETLESLVRTQAANRP